MVSERRRESYVAAVVGESSQGVQLESLVDVNTQRVPAPQRSNVVEDLDNPFYLSSNENPNAILVSPPLSGSNNYATWSISMRVALEVKNKWGIVNGSLPAPEQTHSQYNAWRRCNLIASSWILRSVQPSIAQSVMYMDEAKLIWNDLRRRFSQRDAHRISSLQSEINDLRQGAITIRKDREIDQVIKFLQGLSEAYNSLKSGVLVLDPLPDLHKVLVMAEKFERQLNVMNLNKHGTEFTQANAIHTQTEKFNEPIDSMAAAFNYSNGRRANSEIGGKSMAKCTFCRMNGHTIEKRYKKHGFPPGWIPGYKSKGKQYANAAVAQPGQTFTPQQVQGLISLLDQMGHKQQPSSAAVHN
ncbi:PREDICTED: uncharacterized protein LOC109147233 [Ipomoea nil]|uniref:uncharacterized protein LOC109147233 n=1 Tax=Ipomoea nil TaxID=35883 RepID=UPI00090167D9|nr:PREDICTED: uncharacterized protein LOC109147233 [Ipomoea nil]